jgi:tetratricopeptide (TPR) repeat protein
MTSALPKSAAYDLAIQLARRIQRHFLVSGPRRARVAEWVRSLVDRDARQPPRRFEMLDAAEAFERGLDAHERMEYAAARQAFGEAAQRAPRNPLPLAWRSRVAALMRQDRDADESADRAFELSTDGLPAADRMFVEAVVADARDPAAAGERYRELVSRYPDEPAWLIELAAFEDAQGRVSNAEDAYNRALQLDPGLARPHLELCRLYSPSRLNDSAAARRHGEAALQAYRSLGNQGGEVQARWCLSDVLRAGTDEERRAARQHADTALQTMQSLQYPYGLARAYNYVGVVALLAERDGREAAAFFQKSLAGVREVGNRFLEPRLLMNLGVSYELVGDRSTAVKYYRDSFALFEELGNQQEAAWNRVNAAAILIDYGGDVEQGVRDAQNARSVFEKLGDKYFEVFARRMIASYYRHVGRTDDALRELEVALGIAQDRQLEDRIAQVLIDRARLRIDQGDYADAERALLEALPSASGTDRVHARIELARAHTRLGRFAVAEQALMEVAQEIVAVRDDGSWPLLHGARGELAYEAGRRSDARAAFAQAAAFWTDDLPEAPSVEARAYAGLLDAQQGRDARGRAEVVAAVEQARRMRRLALEARCLVLLARIDVARSRFDDAIRTLESISADGQRAAGPEVRAQAEYWRGQALARRGDRDAAVSAAENARRVLDELGTRIPEPDRGGWLARPDIKLASGS